MIDFQASREAVISASPEKVFGIVSDLENHAELAGSGELQTVRKLTPGPVGFGTVIEADEKVRMGDQTMDLVAKSVVVTCDSPNSVSWISSPVGLPVRRIQWWFNLTPQGTGTKVVHEVEVEFGPQTVPEMLGLVPGLRPDSCALRTGGHGQDHGELEEGC